MLNKVHTTLLYCCEMVATRWKPCQFQDQTTFTTLLLGLVEFNTCSIKVVACVIYNLKDRVYQMATRIAYSCGVVLDTP